VKALFIKQGQVVKKGQLLLKLDDAIIQQNLVAARQGLESIKTQLCLRKKYLPTPEKFVGSGYWHRSTVDYCKK
jgi:hypothetical protein